MIGTFWFQLNEIKAGARRPKNIKPHKVSKVGILGAGMMGAGIAYSSACRGINVILKDISLESAKKGKDYSQKLLGKKVSSNRLTAEQHDATLNAIFPTDNASDLNGCDLIIEAVFEDRELKANVTQEAEAQINADAVFASNTSTLPITGLAKASIRPKNFIGLHFFSPVDKMPLVEIICGEKTSNETLAKAYDYVLQIGKTPIVVNDSRGFYTSRVFGTYASEGIAMLGEGIPAAAIENAAFLAGFPVGPLAISDEVSLTLMAKIRNQGIKDLEAESQEFGNHPADVIIDQMIKADRPGKLAGGGFYDYPKGNKKHLWKGLKENFESTSVDYSLDDLKDRLLYIQAIETARCIEENVLTSVRDANIGSIMGIGYPVWTGGTLQFINQVGIPAFIKRANQLSLKLSQQLSEEHTEKDGKQNKNSDRFAIPQLLNDMAQQESTFTDSDN